MSDGLLILFLILAGTSTFALLAIAIQLLNIRNALIYHWHLEDHILK